MSKTIVGWDLETEPFAPGVLVPEPICVAADFGDGQLVFVAHCDPEFDEVLEMCLDADLSVNTNIAFDMSVLVAHRPHLAPKVWAAYRENRVTDIMIRDMLLALADTGDLSFEFLENGAKRPLLFSQLEMEKRHLGIDRSADKDDEDAPRKNYVMMKGIPASEYPEDFRQYPLHDASNAREIYFKQEKIAAERGGLDAQFLNARAAFALYLSSSWGFEIDTEYAQEMLDGLAPMAHESNFPGLLETGILRPSSPLRPYKTDVKKALAFLGNAPVSWEPHREALEAQGVRFTKPEPASRNISLLTERIAKVCDEFEITPILTDSGAVSYGEEMMVALAGMDPVLDEYIEREKISKLVANDLPRLLHPSGRVHPKYRILVKTGRTSSHGNSKRDTNPPYPAVNVQQVDPRIRNAFLPTPGRVLCSIDYNYIELVSAAQTCVQLFGESVLADKINAGYDPHAFLGAVIARMFSDGEFAGSEDLDENYQLFINLKKAVPKFYKHYRNLAKPTGLGYPGGLGPRRFIGYAKSTFGIDIVKLAGSMEAAVEMATKLRNVWLATFPEFRRYFDYVSKMMVDHVWSVPDDTRYYYQSPHGMIRRNCVYTEATNGAALQTRTAEGAKIALWRLAEEMYDDTLGSPILGVRMCGFVHDEVLLDIPEDDHMHERAFHAARVWVEGMKQVMPDVKTSAEPALMRRWNKGAEPAFDNDNRLKVWTP